MPAEKTTYALRDIEHLKHIARGHGDAIGAYAEAVLEHPLPWTKMRQVYALFGLVKKWSHQAGGRHQAHAIVTSRSSLSNRELITAVRLPGQSAVRS